MGCRGIACPASLIAVLPLRIFAAVFVVGLLGHPNSERSRQNSRLLE
jgi:hypothetical protein